MRELYFDYNATTPLDPLVLESMTPYFQTEFGNSMSTGYGLGERASTAVERARKQVASLLGCESSEITFTSGATESNNWMIQGLIHQHFLDHPNTPIHILASPIEHSSVVNTLKAVSNWPLVTVEWLEVQKDGRISVADLKKKIKPETTRLISCMWVHNELGVINSIEEIGNLARENKIYFHTDGTQAVGKIKIDLSQLPVDALSLSAHKIYGPKGVGALFLKKRNPMVRIQPLLYGGGHEKGARSGTLAVPQIVGMGKACEIIQNQFSREVENLTKLGKLLADQLRREFPEITFNGHQELKVPTTWNVTFNGHRVPSMIPNLSVSQRSACQTGDLSPSPTLAALGLSIEQADRTFRLSLGRTTQESDIHELVSLLKAKLQPNPLEK